MAKDELVLTKIGDGNSGISGTMMPVQLSDLETAVFDVRAGRMIGWQPLTGTRLVRAWETAMGKAIGRLHRARKSVRQTWLEGWRDQILRLDPDVARHWRGLALLRAQAMIMTACVSADRRYADVHWPEAAETKILRFRAWSILLETHRLVREIAGHPDAVARRDAWYGSFPELFGDLAAQAEERLHALDDGE